MMECKTSLKFGVVMEVVRYYLELTASSWLVVDVLTRVVNAGLDDVIHGEATGGGLAPQLAVDLLVQHLRGRWTGR